MRFATALVALLPAVALALDKPLDIEVTNKVECQRKTVAGDKIDAHYRGTLEDGTGTFTTVRKVTPLRVVWQEHAFFP